MNNSYKHLLPYGYAPGSYIGTCHSCRKAISDIDKRATNCRDCAQTFFEVNAKRENAKMLLAQILQESRPPFNETLCWEGREWATVEETRTFAHLLLERCDKLEEQLLEEKKNGN